MNTDIIEKVYSTDEDSWVSEIDDIKDEIELEVEPIQYVYEGNKRILYHSDFISACDIIDAMKDRAYDDFNDLSDDYLDDIDNEKILILEELLNKWFNENVEQPKFYQVYGIKKIEFSKDF